MNQENKTTTAEEVKATKPKRTRKTTPKKSEFETCIDHVFENEGILSDDPVDRGGLTKYGVTISTYKKYWKDKGEEKTDDDLRKATKAEVLEIYRQNFWEPSRVEQLPKEIRMTYFDMVVNHGQGNAVRILQKAINLGRISLISEDGLIGKNTISHAKKVSRDKLQASRALFYANLIARRPQQEKFWLGWYRRCKNT